MASASKISILLLVAILISASCFAQSNTDTIASNDTSQKKEVKKLKLIFSFDARRSKLLGTKVKINGMKIGVEFHEKHRMGFGLFPLATPVSFTGKIDTQKYLDATDSLYFNFVYISTFYEYIWLKNKRWELSTPFHFGTGTSELTYIDTLGNRSLPFKIISTSLITVGFSAQFKIFRWLALGSGFGYRKLLTREENIKKPLNAPFYQIQIKILFGELFRMAFKKDELEEW